jgi:hypothetical protein
MISSLLHELEVWAKLKDRPIWIDRLVSELGVERTLELAKVLTTLWLHRYWHSIPLLLKSYLTGAVLVLMLITSLGVFGFLSRAHIAQERAQATLQIEEQAITNKLSLIETQAVNTAAQIDRYSSTDWFDEIKKRIDVEELQLVTLQETKKNLQQDIEQTNATIQKEIDTAQSLLAARKISELQTILQVEPDGNFGANTRSVYDSYISSRSAKLQAADTTSIDLQIKQTQDRISNLQSQLISPEQTQQELAKYKTQASEIEQEQLTLSTKLEEVLKKQAEFEVEVGPITFISELFFGTSDEDSSRTTIRLLIITIIMVFDPLAILLVIAASMTINKNKDELSELNDKLPTKSKLLSLIEVNNDVLYWKEREDKAFNARWANKPLGQQVTIDGKRYKTKAILEKLKQ